MKMSLNVKYNGKLYEKGSEVKEEKLIKVFSELGAIEKEEPKEEKKEIKKEKTPKKK